MMKTLCVAVVVLSLTSVCQPASLACEKLLKPVDDRPDVSGRWYLIALSSDNCLIPAIINSAFWPSMAVDIAATDTPNIYKNKFMVNIYGFCTTEVNSFFYGDDGMYAVDSNNSTPGEPVVLLQSGCPDCLIVKGNYIMNILLLLSKRKTVTAAEMKEFETQADCLGFYKQVMNSDHEYETCKSLDDDIDFDSSGLSDKIYQRLKNTYTVPLNCLREAVLYYLTFIILVAFEWVKQMWNSFW